MRLKQAEGRSAACRCNFHRSRTMPEKMWQRANIGCFFGHGYAHTRRISAFRIPSTNNQVSIWWSSRKDTEDIRESSHSPIFNIAWKSATVCYVSRIFSTGIEMCSNSCYAVTGYESVRKAQFNPRKYRTYSAFCVLLRWHSKTGENDQINSRTTCSLVEITTASRQCNRIFWSSTSSFSREFVTKAPHTGPCDFWTVFADWLMSIWRFTRKSVSSEYYWVRCSTAYKVSGTQPNIPSWFAVTCENFALQYAVKMLQFTTRCIALDVKTCGLRFEKINLRSALLKGFARCAQKKGTA